MPKANILFDIDAYPWVQITFQKYLIMKLSLMYYEENMMHMVKNSPKWNKPPLSQSNQTKNPIFSNNNDKETSVNNSKLLYDSNNNLLSILADQILHQLPTK